ncbi:MAG: TIGR03862 family flavoprotein [Mangrovicoccus sp.]|nr:TIGR03862 family flavoprotein [Mangrovicoccus sp.]
MEKIAALVIGGGPAGLMAAEMLGRAGHSVVIADAMPSLGRKFLMAGKSGLNLTKAEPREAFCAAYGEAEGWLRPALRDFGPNDVQLWAQDLGQELFTGSTGRVFPKVMKASPLLRAWLRRLEGLGVQSRLRWRWNGCEQGLWRFDSPAGARCLAPGVVVLALGGASWARLGSDGAWAGIAARQGVELADFAPANAGLCVAWSDHMRRHFGAPVKGIALRAGDLRSRGEVVLSASGIEGGGIYPLSPALRDGAPLFLDLAPDRSAADLAARLARPKGKASWSNHLRKTLGVSPVARALLAEFARPLPQDPTHLAELIKALPVLHQGLRPMDEAISTAGGITRAALDGHYMLRAHPGVFAAGEMLDWEAPTGGYLLTACLATGRAAGIGAAAWLARSDQVG